MVRIPRSEQSVGYGAQMQPFSSGDGYEAPGKAQQQLGKAIQSFGGRLASLGDSFNADAEKEDAYRTQLTALEYDDKLDRDLTEYKMTADPEKWDQYSAGAAERIGRITQEYMPKLSPKGQQQFSLHAARRHNQAMSSAREHQYSLQRQNLFTRSAAGIDTVADRLYARYPIEAWNREEADGIYVPPDPNEIAANAAAALQAQESVIGKYPGTPAERDKLRKQALDSLGKFITNNIPPAWQEQVGSAIDAQLRASAPPEAPVVPGTTPQGTMHRWGGGAGHGQMPTYRPGRVSATYESGGRGVGFVSSGRGDPGGQSYGIHQLSTKDSMGAFLRASEGQAYADKFKGLRPGTDAFNQVYKSIAAADPDGFANAQYAFYARTHYDPVKAHAQKLGFAVDDRGVQEALFSMGVQHGGARKIVSAAADAANKGPAEQVRALYEARSAYVKRIDLPEQTRASVLNRYRSEVRDALALVGSAGNDQVASRQEPQNDNIRAPNTIPAEAGGDQAPIRVADAGGGIPQSAQPRMLPSGERGVGSHFNEWWREHQTAFRKTGSKAVDGLVSRIEKAASEGYLPHDAELARTSALVDSIGDYANTPGAPTLRQRLDGAIMGARYNQQLGPMRPEDIREMARSKRADMAASGKASAEELAAVEYIEKYATTAQTQLDKDQLTYAVKRGVIPHQPTLDPDPRTFSPDALALRLDAAEIAAEHFSRSVVYFNEAERTTFAEHMKKGGTPLLATLKTIYEAAGPKTPAVMAELGKGAEVAATIGWMVHANVPQQTLNDAADGLALVQDPKFHSRIPGTENLVSYAKQVYGDAFLVAPKTQQANIDTARAIYEWRAHRKGVDPKSFDKTLFTEALAEVVGQTKDVKTGEVYGGVILQDAPGWFTGDVGVAVPPNVKQNGFRDLIENIRVGDLLALEAVPQPAAGVTQVTGPADVPEIMRGALAAEKGAMSAAPSATAAPAPASEDGAAFSSKSGWRSADPKQTQPTAPQEAGALLGGIPGAMVQGGTVKDAEKRGVLFDRDGRPKGIEALRKATLVTVGEGRYLLATKDPREADPGYIRGSNGQAYVLDLNRLAPRLKARMPGAFRAE